MSWELVLRNRQRARPVDLRLLRRITRALLRDHLETEGCSLGIHLISAAEMARLNRQFLQHEGSTDVITFDYGPESVGDQGRAASAPAGAEGGMTRIGERNGSPAPEGSANVRPGRRPAHPRFLHGEIFICVEEAVAQGVRFGSGWPSELVRYLIHGLLHLQGFDDLRPEARRRMKRAEGRLLKRAAAEFALPLLERRPDRRRSRPHVAQPRRRSG